MNNEKIELQVPKEDQGKLKAARDRINNKYRLSRQKEETHNSEASEEAGAKKEEEDSDEDFLSEGEDQVGAALADGRPLDYHAYRYSVQSGGNDIKSSYEVKDLSVRKLQYVTVRKLIVIIIRERF